ncbi:MAG: IS1634 family transposase [Nanoarchaeota archaeon]
MINKNPNNKSFSVGAFEFVKKYYSKLELFDVINKLKSKGVPIDKLTKGMITFKFEHNLSIHKCGEWINQPHILNQFQLKLFHEKALYRTLETLGQNEELVITGIQDKLFSKYKFKHTDSNLDWSSLVLHGKASPLGRFGFSSDHRPDKRQIAFGIGELAKPINVPFVLTIKAGNIPCKTHFKDTFLQGIKHLKDDSHIIIDRGANTKKNKELVRSKKKHYLTARILSGKDNKIISQFSRSKKVVLKKKNKRKETVYYKKLKQGYEFQYVCFSPKLHEEQISKKQKKIDEELQTIKQLSDKLKAGKKIKNLREINLPDRIIEQKVSIQKKLIAQTDKEIRKYLEEIHINGREGFYILESSMDLTGKQAIQAYKNKDSVEKVMNSLKNEIEIKPVRVWTDSSIKGALIIGFVAQLFVSLSRFESEKLKSFSTTTILNSLKNLTLTIKNSGDGLIEQIISNIDENSKVILPNLAADPG